MSFRFKKRPASEKNNGLKNKYVNIFILLTLFIVNVIAGSRILNNHFPWYSNISIFLLVNINIILLIVVCVLIFRNLSKLYIDRKKNVFGTRLQGKLVTFSIIIAVIPVFIVFIFSNTVINKSIDKWFNSQIQVALESATDLVQKYQTRLENYLIEQGGILAEFISSGDYIYSSSHTRLHNFVRTYIEKDRIDGLSVYNMQMQKIVDIHKTKDYAKKFANGSVVKKILNKELIARYEFDGKDQIYWVGEPVYSSRNQRSVIGAIIIYKHVPENEAEKVANILDSYNTYRQTKFFAKPVKNSFKILTMLMTLLVVFAAMWGSLIYAKSITRPIESLASASVAVSKGDLDVEVDIIGNDELAFLTRAFNSMVKRLKTHNTEMNLKNEKLSEMFMQIARDNQYIDSIFKNVKSAIFLYTGSFEVLKKNWYADDILGCANETYISNVLTPAAAFVESEDRETVFQVEMMIKGELRTFTSTITKIFGQDNNVENLVIVLDDITDLLNSQRVGIWKETATRIAHEIKNPLTPIKLTAERIRRKAQMGESEQNTIISSMDTIIAEVESLQSMVNEFNMFARLPEIKKTTFRLDEFFDEVKAFYGASHHDLEIDVHCGQEEFTGDRPQLKRVFINLVNNSIEAMENSGKIIISVVEKGNVLRIDYKDNGKGIPQEDVGRIFIPYFSKKPEGTGLGLAIVKKIIESHNGTITVDSQQGKYTQFTMEFKKA